MHSAKAGWLHAEMLGGLAGLAFIPMTVATFIAAVAVPKITKRFGNGLLMVGALALLAVGMAWLSRIDADSHYLTDSVKVGFWPIADRHKAMGCRRACRPI